MTYNKLQITNNKLRLTVMDNFVGIALGQSVEYCRDCPWSIRGIKENFCVTGRPVCVPYKIDNFCLFFSQKASAIRGMSDRTEQKGKHFYYEKNHINNLNDNIFIFLHTLYSFCGYKNCRK